MLQVRTSMNAPGTVNLTVSLQRCLRGKTGFSSWLRHMISGGSGTKSEPKIPLEKEINQSRVTLRVSVEHDSCLEVAGTTTFARNAVSALAERKGLAERGYYEAQAQLQRDVNNPVDPQAVAVILEGQKVGCLPSYIAKNLPLPSGAGAPVRYQLHILQGAKFLAKAYVWLGDGTPEWIHTKENPPTLTAKERIISSHAQKSTMVREALQEGGERAQRFKRGMVDGVHYLELIEPIKQLKREGSLEEALALCYKAIEGAESGAGRGMPAPAYTVEAAIILRKLSRKDEEMQVLRRWLAHCPKNQRAGSKIAERLNKLEGK